MFSNSRCFRGSPGCGGVRGVPPCRPGRLVVFPRERAPRPPPPREPIGRRAGRGSSGPGPWHVVRIKALRGWEGRNDAEAPVHSKPRRAGGGASPARPARPSTLWSPPRGRRTPRPGRRLHSWDSWCRGTTHPWHFAGGFLSGGPTCISQGLTPGQRRVPRRCLAVLTEIMWPRPRSTCPQ